MPLLLDKPVGKNSRLALWHITENIEELHEKLNCEIDPLLLQVNEQLIKQRISARILTNLLCSEPCTEIKYDEHNKPFLKNSTAQISISHAHTHVAVIINRANSTGIDIELVKAQVQRIATRFMSETELKTIDKIRKMEQLTTYWCAKEALYKYYGKKELWFRENIFIDPFQQANSGNLSGSIRTPHVNISLPLCYEKFENYMLVYVND